MQSNNNQNLLPLGMGSIKITVFADYKSKVKNANITDPILLQVALMDDRINKLDWNKIKSEQSMLDVINSFAQKEMNGLFEKAKGQYSDKLKFIDDLYADGFTYQEIEQYTDSLSDMNMWVNILNSEKATYGNPFKYIVLFSLVGRPKIKPNYDAIETLFDFISSQPTPTSVKGIIAKYEEIYASLNSKGIDIKKLGVGKITGWIETPGGNKDNLNEIQNKEDIRNFIDADIQSQESRGAFVANICKGTGWCLSSLNTATSYTGFGSIFFYLDAGAPKLCIRLEHGTILEITGVNNSRTNAYVYVNQFLEFYESHPNMKKQFLSYNAKNQNHCIDIPMAKKALPLFEKYNGTTLEEIVKDFDICFDYLTEATIEKCWPADGNEDPLKEQFKQKARARLNSSTPPMFEFNISRLPYFKNDKEMIDKAVTFMLKALKDVYISGYAGMLATMSNVNPLRLNNSFKNRLVRDKQVQDLIINSYDFLSKENTVENKSLLRDIEDLISKSGLHVIYEDKANALIMDKLEKGDINSVNNIALTFKLPLDKFKDKALPLMKARASELIIDNMEAFDSMNKMVGGALTEEPTYSSIIEEARPKAALKAQNYLSKKEMKKLEDIVSRFDNIKEDPEFNLVAIDKATSWIVDDAYSFNILDNILGGKLLTEFHEQIITKAMPEAMLKAEFILYGNQNLDLLKALNERFNNKIFTDKNFYSLMKERAIEHLTKENAESFEDIKSILSENDMKEIYHNAFLNLHRKIMKAFIEMDSTKLADYNKLTNGEVKRNKEFLIENSIDMAIEHSCDKLLKWQIIRHVQDPNPLLIFGKLNYSYSGKLILDKSIKNLAMIIYSNVANSNDPYFVEIKDYLVKIFGSDMFTKSTPVRVEHKKTNKNEALMAFEKNELEHLQVYIQEEPSLQNDLLPIAINKVKSLLNISNPNARARRNQIIRKIDNIFNGKVLIDPTILSMINNRRAAGDSFE